MITKNAQKMLGSALASTARLVDEIVVVDGGSTDNTLGIAKKFDAKTYSFKSDDLGKQRAYGLKKISTEWVLVLDSDEIVTKKLAREIKSKIRITDDKTQGYYIPFQNHFLGRKLHYGGENYKKLILFKRKFASIDAALVHENFKVQGKVGNLKNKVLHYSYNSLLQMYVKFTDYAIREARQKARKGERTDLKKIFFYAPHMFWARFIKDKGYKDGFFRLPLDIGFAYMEFLTYLFMLFAPFRTWQVRKRAR